MNEYDAADMEQFEGEQERQPWDLKPTDKPTDLQELLAKLFYDQFYFELGLAQKVTIDASIPAISRFYESAVPKLQTKPDKDCAGKEYSLGIMAGHNSTVRQIHANFKQIRGGKS